MRALATTEIRILAPIPGKQAVGVEVPNLTPNLVTLGDIFGDIPAPASPLAVWLGKGIDGQPVYSDLARMPHLLIAGTTGSGKSGCINIHPHLDPAAARPPTRCDDPRRPQAHRAQLLRVDPATLLTPVVSSPKEAKPAARCCSTSSPRWSAATNARVAGAGARPSKGGQPGAAQAGRARAPLPAGGDRRAGRPDDASAPRTSRTRSSAWPRSPAPSASTLGARHTSGPRSTSSRG